MTRVDLRAEVAGMPPAEALAYALDYFDYLFPKPADEWRLHGVKLTRQQSRLLRCLWEARGRVVTFDVLLGVMRGDLGIDHWGFSNTLRVQVHRVRPKIAPFMATIHNQWGIGYALHLPKGGDLPWVAA